MSSEDTHYSVDKIGIWRTVLSGLVVAAIVGTIALYAHVSSLEAKIDDVQVTVERIWRMIEPRYRGAEPTQPEGNRP